MVGEYDDGELPMHAPNDSQLTSELIDHVYAAMFGEAPWQAFMDHSRNLLPNGQTVLFYHDKASQRGAFSMASGLDQGMVDRYNHKYHAVNPWMDHATVRPLGRVMQADEMLPRNHLLQTDFYREYLRPQDIITGLGVTLSRDEDRHFFFSIVCSNADSDLIENAKRTISSIVPHLTRASGVLKAATTEGRLSGTLRIDSSLRVVSADGGALELIQGAEGFSVGPFGRLACADTDILRMIQHVLASGREGPANPAVHYAYIKRRDDTLPLRVCIYRPGRAGSAYVGSADCFIRLECPSTSLRDGARRFGAMHRLSSAETGIVARMVDGLTLEQIAAERGTSPDTVKTQIKNIYRKTGCSRQADIMRHVAVVMGTKVVF
ncbi:helix-turn-helix transcriptional regulator [Paracoccus gahaiensis]|nr:helix-turn-helix transcriptional regulator [Paracoccus gahaiensis]